MARRLAAAGIFLALLFPATAPAQKTSVCLVDGASLAEPARGAFHREFILLLSHRAEPPAWSDSGRCGANALRIRIRAGAEERFEDALGRVRVESQHVTDEIELFLEPLRQSPELRGWESIGRALARVAAHEVVHYLDQRLAHDGDGLMRPVFSFAALADSDSLRFRQHLSGR